MTFFLNIFPNNSIQDFDLTTFWRKFIIGIRTSKDVLSYENHHFLELIGRSSYRRMSQTRKKTEKENSWIRQFLLNVMMKTGSNSSFAVVIIRISPSKVHSKQKTFFCDKEFCFEILAKENP